MIKYPLLFLFIIVLANCASVNPPDLHSLMKDYTIEYYNLYPDRAIARGIGPEMGIENQDRFSDTSPALIKRAFSLDKKYYNSLIRIDRQDLSEKDLIFYEVFKYYLEQGLEREKFKYHRYIINPVFSTHSHMITMITEHIPVQYATDITRYLNFMKQIPIRLSQDRELLEYQVSRGILPSFRILESYFNDFLLFTEMKPEENPLFSTLELKTADMEITQEEKDKFLSECKEIILKTVYPAYNDYMTYIASLRDKFDDYDGVWKLPKGDEFYRYSLKFHLTSDISPAEIHEMGKKEVKFLQGEITKLVSSLGIPPKDTYQETIRAYWQHCSEKPDLRYSDSEEGKRQTILDYIAIVEETEEKLSHLFRVLPETPVTVKPVPFYKEKTAGTYYQSAPLDGSGQGIFYANMGYRHFKPNMHALTYHETIPGHHLQIAIQQEAGLPLFFTIPFFTAFIEGWALYAEQLAYEQDWYPDIYSRIGYLTSALFRAARMVVDTGIHYKRWSRESSLDYLQKTLGRGGDGQINRYSVWPGQACAYMYGKLVILQLRDKVKEELGDAFDIKEFHEIILENGALPLSLLEKTVYRHYGMM